MLNLFAGIVRLEVGELRVDIDESTQPDFVSDAFDFVRSWRGAQFNTIILDPPYNLRKAREKYQERYIGSFQKIKEQVQYILNPGGRIITLGYDTVGMSRRRGFEKEAVIIVCHGGDHNDTLCVVERYVSPPLFSSAFNVPFNHTVEPTPSSNRLKP